MLPEVIIVFGNPLLALLVSPPSMRTLRLRFLAALSSHPPFFLSTGLLIH